jgi:rRNA-processing protein FCF1
MAADNLQVLFDLNIILDVLQERIDFYIEILKMLFS